MKKRSVTIVIAVAAVLACLMSGPATAQSVYPKAPTQLNERNMGGPRLGMTYVLGKGDLYTEMQKKNIGPMMSQFGWHFEYDVIPDGGGPAFVIQFVPLLSGVEYGTIIPSASLLMGIRLPGGFEFGLGPNLLPGSKIAPTSIVMAVGKSFDYGGVSIPLNLAFTANREGNRVTLLFGYALNK